MIFIILVTLNSNYTNYQECSIYNTDVYLYSYIFIHQLCKFIKCLVPIYVAVVHYYDSNQNIFTKSLQRFYECPNGLYSM